MSKIFLLYGFLFFTEILIELNIPSGIHTLEAWFKDKNGKNICGAYYVRVTKLNIRKK